MSLGVYHGGVAESTVSSYFCDLYFNLKID